MNRKLKNILKEANKPENRQFKDYIKEEFLDGTGVPTLKHNKTLHLKTVEVCHMKKLPVKKGFFGLFTPPTESEEKEKDPLHRMPNIQLSNLPSNTGTNEMDTWN